MNYIGNTIVETFRLVTENAKGNGVFTLSNPDGTVISVQPDGSIQTRPAGTNGPFEQCTISDKGYLYGSSNPAIAYLFARV